MWRWCGTNASVDVNRSIEKARDEQMNVTVTVPWYTVEQQ